MSSATPNRNLAINYVEMNVGNVARAKAFYGSAFGWTFTDYGPEYAEFSDGALKGGFTTLGTVTAGGGPLVIRLPRRQAAALHRPGRLRTGCLV